jgi:hypothetical protein
MSALIVFCSHACQSCLVASDVFHPSFCSMVASTSRSQSRFASGTSDHTKLKSPAQLSCNAGHHLSQSIISFCHSSSYLYGPTMGHAINFEPTTFRCRALMISVIWTSVGFVADCRLMIYCRTLLSSCRSAFVAIVVVLMILL